MNTVVIYDSKFGNTEKIAEAIARGAGTRASVQVLSVDAVAGSLVERPDLLLVGGPTQRRGMSPGLKSFVDALPASLQGAPVAAFDTRYKGAKLLMGSAAVEVTKRLEKAGVRSVAQPASFFIARGGPLEAQGLESGELERAEKWGGTVAAAALKGG